MKHLSEDQIKKIFGLKLKQCRTEKDLSLLGLSKLTGLSKSYLNEIEKGKKYPKQDKIIALAEALETSYEELVSVKLKGNMASLGEIVQSGVLKEMPLNLFGIDENSLIDIISGAPEKVTAFIGTIFEMTREHNITKEYFYLSSLRGFQERKENYFERIEQEVEKFAKRYQLDLSKKVVSEELEEILKDEFNYSIDDDQLTEQDYPDAIRSVFIPKEKRLLIAKPTSETQRVFILAKELAYAHLGISQRPLTFTWIKFSHFEEVLNNFRASYFAGALILPKERFTQDLESFFQSKKWDPKAFLSLLHKYTDSAETFFQRLTNVLPHEMGIRDIFFLRFHTKSNQLPQLNKELHLSKKHQPHKMDRREHYCMRWVSTDILINQDDYVEMDGIRVGVQISRFHENGANYLVITSSNADPFKADRFRSVCIGIELNNRQRKKIGFVKDEQIQKREVNQTCERCGILDCKERLADADIFLREKRNQEIEKRVYNLIGKV